MRKWLALDGLREAIAEYPAQIGTILVIAVAVGASVGTDTRSVLGGLVSTVGSILICVAIWPLIKRV